MLRANVYIYFFIYLCFHHPLAPYIKICIQTGRWSPSKNIGFFFCLLTAKKKRLKLLLRCAQEK